MKTGKVTGGRTKMPVVRDAVKNEKPVVKGTRPARSKTQSRPRRFQNLSGIMIRFGHTNTNKLRGRTKYEVHITQIC